MDLDILPDDCWNLALKFYLSQYSYKTFIKKILEVRQLYCNKTIEKDTIRNIIYYINNFALIINVKRVCWYWYTYFNKWGDGSWYLSINKDNLFSSNSYLRVVSTLKEIANFVLFGCRIIWKTERSLGFSEIRSDINFYFSEYKNEISITHNISFNGTIKKFYNYINTDVDQKLVGSYHLKLIDVFNYAKIYHKKETTKLISAIHSPIIQTINHPINFVS